MQCDLFIFFRDWHVSAYLCVYKIFTIVTNQNKQSNHDTIHLEESIDCYLDCGWKIDG